MLLLAQVNFIRGLYINYVPVYCRRKGRGGVSKSAKTLMSINVLLLSYDSLHYNIQKKVDEFSVFSLLLRDSMVSCSNER